MNLTASQGCMIKMDQDVACIYIGTEKDLFSKDAWESWIIGLNEDSCNVTCFDIDSLPTATTIMSCFRMVVLVGELYASENHPHTPKLERLFKSIICDEVPSKDCQRPRVLAIGYGCRFITKILGGEVSIKGDLDAVRLDTIDLENVFYLFPWSILKSEKPCLNVVSLGNEIVKRLPGNAIPLSKNYEMYYIATSNGGGVWCMQFHPIVDSDQLMNELLLDLPIDSQRRILTILANDGVDADLLQRMVYAFLFSSTMELEESGDHQLTVTHLRGYFQDFLQTMFTSRNFVEVPNQSSPGLELYTPLDKSRLSTVAMLLRGEPWTETGDEDRIDVYNPLIAKSIMPVAQTVQNTKCVTLSSIHTMNILCVASVNDTQIMSGAADKTVCLVEGEQVLSKLLFDAPVTSIKRLSAERMLVGALDGSLTLVHVDNNTISREDSSSCVRHTKLLTCLAVSACGKWFASCGRDGAVHVYRISDNSLVEHDTSFQCSNVPEALEFVSVFGGLQVVVSIRGESELLYVMIAKEETDSPLQVGEVQKISVNANEDDHVSFTILALSAAPHPLPMLAAATDRNRILLFRTGSTCQYRNLYGHSCTEYGRPSLAWHPSALFLASTSEIEMEICVWSVVTEELVLRMPGHSGSIRGLDFSPRGLISCSFDRTIRVWQQVDEIKEKLE